MTKNPKPLESILNRDLVKAALVEFRTFSSELLQELVNHGTKALARCDGTAPRELDTHVAPSAIYRKGLVCLDGIEILLAEGAVEAATVPLRGLFESSLFLEWMLIERETMREKALAWLVCHVRFEINRLEHIRGTGLLKDGAHLESLDEQEARLRSFLEKPHVKAIASDHRLGGEAPRWHKVGGGPPTISAIAVKLDRTHEYNLFYRQWSRSTHSQSMRGWVSTDGSSLHPIRGYDGTELSECLETAAQLGLKMTSQFINFYRPSEDLSRWYLEQIKPKLNRLAKQRERDVAHCLSKEPRIPDGPSDAD